MSPAPALSIPLASGPAVEVSPETRCYHFQPTRPFSSAEMRREIEIAERAGFNAVLFPVYVDGYTLFPSEAARARRFPAIHPAFRSWDPVAEAAALCHDLGMNFWGFARPYNFHPRYSLTSHRLLRKFPEWRIRVHPKLKRLSQRRREGYVACPVNFDYRRYLGDLLCDVVFGYPVEALVVNYTGYGLRQGPVEFSPFCFCPTCRRLYEEAKGRPLVSDALDPDRILAVREWQTEVSHVALEYLRHRVLKVRRTLRLFCRAQPQWRWSEEDSGSQLQAPFTLDWNRLIASGAVEELILDHDDETAPEMFRTRLVSDLANLHDEALILPAAYASRPEDLEDPVAAIRRYPAAGILVEFATPPTEAQADAIRERLLGAEARSPDTQPLFAVAYLLRSVQELHPDNPLLADFMRDFLRIIERQIRRGPSFQMLQIVLENLGGLQAAIRRGRLGDYRVAEPALRNLGLARRIVRLACLDVRT